MKVAGPGFDPCPLLQPPVTAFYIRIWNIIFASAGNQGGKLWEVSFIWYLIPLVCGCLCLLVSSLSLYTGRKSYIKYWIFFLGLKVCWLSHILDKFFRLDRARMNNFWPVIGFWRLMMVNVLLAEPLHSMQIGKSSQLLMSTFRKQIFECEHVRISWWIWIFTMGFPTHTLTSHFYLLV